MNRLLDIFTVAEILSVHPNTVRRWTREGELCPPLNLPHSVRWSQADIDAWIQARRETAPIVRVFETA